MSDKSDFKSRVQRLRKATILDAAIETFSEYGFRGASMKQVARLAGVSEGTLYNVFDDKLALLIAILDPLEERMGNSVTRDSGSDQSPLAARLATFDVRAVSMMRVLLSEALVDTEVRKHFGERIIAPMKSRAGDAGPYAALAVVLGAIMLRLLDQSDQQAEQRALDLINPILIPGRPS